MSATTVPAAEPLDAQIKSLDENLPGGLALPVSADLVKARDQFRRLTVALRDAQPPANLASMEDVEVPGAAGPQKARIYHPHSPIADATLLFIHGGGFVVGDIESYELQVRTIAERTQLTTVSVEYRLAPEDPFPAAAEDAISITEHVLAHAVDFGGSRVIVSGDSAGGGLTAVVAQHVKGIVGQVLIYPVTDFTMRGGSLDEHGDGPVLTSVAGEAFFSAYLSKESDATNPEASPLLADDFASLPPAVVVTDEYDILRDQGLAYAAKLEAAGVPTTHLHYPSLTHGFMGLFPFSTACDAALTDICDATVALLD